MELKVLRFIILLGIIFCETDLLRSKYLTYDMINDIDKLSKYERKARIIFDNYEKAKFYQYVAFIYYEKYLELVEELNSLDRHFYHVFTNYKSEKIYYQIDKALIAPGIQNDFYPILFDESSKIEVKLFRAKADMFEKQYREYLNYFNEKNKIYQNNLGKIKKNKAVENTRMDEKKFFDDYKDFIANVEKINDDNISSFEVTYNEDLIKNISFNGKHRSKREFYYDENLQYLLKTIDFTNEKKTIQTDYNINLNQIDFFNYISKDLNEDLDLDKYGNYSITTYNEFGKITEITYFSSNKSIIGVISREFEEDFLKLSSEKWFLGNYKKIIRKFKNIFEPRTGKNILIEEKYKR